MLKVVFIELLQQADVALPSWAWAALVGVVMLVLGSFITKFTKHSEVTISGPVEIRVLQENYKRIEGLMNQNFDKTNDLIGTYEGRTNEWKDQMFERLGKISLSCERQSWRIETVEKELVNIREKKLTELEKELRELNRRRNGGSPV